MYNDEIEQKFEERKNIQGLPTQFEQRNCSELLSTTS